MEKMREEERSGHSIRPSDEEVGAHCFLLFPFDDMWLFVVQRAAETELKACVFPPQAARLKSGSTLSRTL